MAVQLGARALSIDPRRLVGFAFANADLLIEVDARDRITFAMGAVQAVLGREETALAGLDWRTLVEPGDQPLVEAMFVCLSDGVRRGPVPVRLAGTSPRAASLSARMLPENGGAISCALSPCPCPPLVDSRDGLHPREGFEALARGLLEAARATGVELELAMVELAGLAGADEALNASMAGALRAEAAGGGAAARLSGERFALLRRRDESPEALVRRLAMVAARHGQGGSLRLDAQTVPMEGCPASRVARAMAAALDDFAREGLQDAPPGTLAEAMTRSVRRTLARAGELGAAISQRRFTLAFQPVVRLSDGSAHHHETLVRFEDGASPFAMVRMAEEFDLIEELDQAILEQAVRQLKADRLGEMTLAVNLSGRTITSEPFIAGVRRMIEKDQRLKGRLIFEITESSAIDDLALADRHIQALRQAGSLVCLDDFGAGAASLNYLQKLHVDIVKIDGRYVRDLAVGGREAALVTHLVNLCRELKVRTVAEMVETTEVEAVIREAGFDFAQGWLYGRPADRAEPPTERRAPPAMAARRTGTGDEWR